MDQLQQIKHEFALHLRGTMISLGDVFSNLPEETKVGLQQIFQPFDELEPLSNIITSLRKLRDSTPKEETPKIDKLPCLWTSTPRRQKHTTS